MVRKFKPPTEGAEYVRYLRKDELEKLFEYLEAMAAHSERHLYMLVLVKFLFFTGLRIGEAIQLQWEDIEEYDDPELGKQYRVWFIGKMRTTRRSQKVPEACIELLRELWRVKIGRKPEPNQFVFPPLDARQRRDKQKRILCERNGVLLVEVGQGYVLSDLVATIRERRDSVSQHQ